MNWEAVTCRGAAKPVKDLLATDQCIRCPAPARVRVVLVSGTQIDFCMHDYRQHEVALFTQGATVHQALSFPEGQ